MHGPRGRAGLAAAIALATLLAGAVPARAEEQDAPPSRLWVAFEGQLLTVTADDAPLGAVLRAVGEAAALEVPVIDSSETFTGAFSDLPLLDALDWLLVRRPYMLSYDEAGDPERIVLLWGDASAATPAAPATTGAAAEQASPAQEETWIARRLTSPDRGARIVAVRRLQRLPPDRAAALGLRVLQAEPDPVVRGQLAAALGRVEGDEGVNVLTELLDDEDPSVRIAGARALGGVARDAAAHGLGRTLLHSADPALRQAALESLASHPQESARDYLRRVAARSGDPLADAARWALSGEFSPPAAETVDPASPCLHAAALRKGCLEK
ncbi:MAG: HEAT repeat domain-containing protein [Rhodobacteraceae bacterium]|nr:HEAT repeat domain-containing protein [Paracoccaceae bacterium]